MAQEFDRVNGTEQSLDRAQKRIQEGQERTAPPFHTGAMVECEVTDSGAVKVAHKLGYKPQGYHIMSNQADGAGTLSLKSSSDKHLELELHVPAGAPATKHKLKLWVF